MTDNERKNTGVLCECGGTMNPIRIDTEYGCTEYQCELCKNEFSIWLDMFRQNASPQDNNALVPLDSELLAEYLFKTKEIQSTMLQSKTGCQFFADLVCAKFGKENNSLIPLDKDVVGTDEL